MGTGGCKPAFGSQPGRDDQLVDLDQQDEGKAQYPEEGFQSCLLITADNFFKSFVTSALRLSNGRISPAV